MRVCLLIISIFLPLSASAEVILSYLSDIQVNQDASLNIVETIEINAEGKDVKRGIYRDFPTIYHDRYGLSVHVDFHISEVRRNGELEPYFVNRLENGQRIYIGRENVILPHGLYTYTLSYQINRQIGYFSEHDELYFNALPHGWIFPVHSARVNVHLPPDIPHEKIIGDGYSGKFGSKKKDFNVRVTETNTVAYTMTKSLRAFEGMTVFIKWPKGFVHEPTEAEILNYYIRDNSGTVAGIVGLLVVFLYFVFVWILVGLDPRKGTIIPRYGPPKGVTAAGAHYLINMNFGNESVAAVLTSMATKGYLIIDVGDDKSYFFTRVTEDLSVLDPLERQVAQALFPRRRRTAKFDENNSELVLEIIKMVKDDVQHKHLGVTFKNNKIYLNIAVVLSFVAIEVMFIYEKVNIFLPILGCIAGYLFFLFFKSVEHKKIGAVLGIMFTSFVWLMSITGQGYGNLYFMAIPLLLLLVGIIFTFLLKAPTKIGRNLLNELEGYKMYLSVAERELFEKNQPQAITPEVYEEHLPFAIALGVEKQWGEILKSQFEHLNIPLDSYKPTWCNSNLSLDFSHSNFSNMGSNMSSVISSSSNPPGTSYSGGSGSSGGSGGSSGGGGGGGGGGGW